MGQLPLALALADHARFETFVDGGNAAAVRHVRALAAGAPDVVWLSGPAASGKTHLLQAACRAAAQGGRRAMYVALELMIAGSTFDASPAPAPDPHGGELASVAGGALARGLGLWLDAHFGTKPWATLVLSLVGIGAGSVGVYRLIATSIDQATEARNPRGVEKDREQGP